MLVIVIILLNSLARDITCSTTAKDSLRNDNDIDMLKELLQRMDKMQSHLNKMQGHMDQMDRNNNIRFDQLENNNIKRFDKLEANVQNIKDNVQNIKDNIQNIAAGDPNMQNNIKNMSVVMETIVEQQMVITAEIFTVSQTLPFCCCQYQNTTDRPEIETTTPRPLKSLPTNCAEAMGESGSDSIYKINVTNSNISPLDVYCMKKIAKSIDEEMINGTWLIIQRRQDNTTNFNHNWSMYQYGFGDLRGNFWIGLDKLYALTKSTEQELWIQLEDKDGITAWAKYGHFAIGNENELYALKMLGDAVGSAGDSLRGNKGQKWSTFDKDNDRLNGRNCAEICNGAWWFTDCGDSRLNGKYIDNNTGIIWKSFRDFESLKYAHMAIRPRT